MNAIAKAISTYIFGFATSGRSNLILILVIFDLFTVNVKLNSLYTITSQRKRYLQRIIIKLCNIKAVLKLYVEDIINYRSCCRGLCIHT